MKRTDRKEPWQNVPSTFERIRNPILCSYLTGRAAKRGSFL